MYNAPLSGHPYAPEATGADERGDDHKDAGDIGMVEKALDCVSASSSSRSSSGSGKSFASSASSASSGRRATGSNGDRRHHHRSHGEASVRSEDSQGLWASGGSLCNCRQHGAGSRADDRPVRDSKEEPVLTDDLSKADNVSSVPVTSATRTFARDGSNYFRGRQQELSPSAAVVAATYADPHALTNAPGRGHVYNQATSPSPPATAWQPPQRQTPPRGRQHTPSPLPPRPRTSSAGAAVPSTASRAAAPAGPATGFMTSPSKFIELAGGGTATHPYQIATGVVADGGPPFSSPQHHRQSSVSSSHSVAGSGQSTPLAAAKPPRHPSEERAGMPAVWVDIPPSPIVPFVPTHLESQRRRTPRSGSAPPSPATSTLAASTHSVNSSFSPQAQQMPLSGQASGALSGLTASDAYSCPPPLPERVPLTSPSASVSPASPEVSPSSQLFAKEGKDGFPASPPASDAAESPNAALPIGSYTLFSGRVDVPPQPTPVLSSRLPAGPAQKFSVAKSEEGGSGVATPTAGVATLPRSNSSGYTLDASPHTRVALPLPVSINHRGLYTKPQRSANSTPKSGPLPRTSSAGCDSAASSSGEEGVCSSTSSALKVAPPPPAVKPGLPLNYGGSGTASSAAMPGNAQRTTVTVWTSRTPSYPLGYTETSSAAHTQPHDAAEEVSAVTVSPASPPPDNLAGGAAAVGAPGGEDDLVSSASDGEEVATAHDRATGSSGSGDGETLDRLMDAVKRAKERAAHRVE